MSKNTNLSFLTDYITADITNGRIGINTPSPAYAFDVTGIARTSTSTYLATASGNVGIGTTGADQKLVINQGATSTGQGIPATTGTTQNGILRLRPAVGVYGETLDFGMNVSSTYGWIQATNSGDLATNYALALNPNGGNVGIGTSSPSVFFQVTKNANASNIARIENTTSGTAAYSALQLASSGSVYLYNFSNAYTTSGKFAAGTFLIDVSNTNGININTSQSTPILFSTTDSERMRITSAGFVGIGTSGPNYVTTIADSTWSNGSTVSYLFNIRKAYGLGVVFGCYIGEYSQDSTGFTINQKVFNQAPSTTQTFTINNSGNYSFWGSNVSDKRLKRNINYIQDSQLDKIMLLKPATFNKIIDNEINTNVHTGFIAQDILESNIPNLIMGSEETSYGLDYDGILALAVKAIQELSTEINLLKQK